MISVEGLVMPNKPLTSLEILDAVRKLEIPRFRGVFLRDNLPVAVSDVDIANTSSGHLSLHVHGTCLLSVAYQSELICTLLV